MKAKRLASRTTKMRSLIVIFTFLIGLAMLFYGGENYYDEEKQLSSIVVLTFGATFLASAFISFIMLVAGFLDLNENAKDLAGIIGTELGMPCAERFNLVDSASDIGLKRVYIDRNEALEVENFYVSIDQEHDEIFVIGSSLLGLLVDRHFTHVVDLLKKKIKKDVELKFMMTHPLFADFRAAQEGRDPKDIGNEIIASLREILNQFDNSNSLVSVYLYRGTPSIFGICTSESMLLNPYPYGRQAYESPCFELVHGKPAYNFYRQAHFQTQFAGKIERIDLSDESIDILQKIIPKFAESVTEFESRFKLREIMTHKEEEPQKSDQEK